jgi:protein-S-isoprenylcysteine O-methyltransferase Ste14
MTTAAVHATALTVVAVGAYLRGAGVVLALVRTFLQRKQFVTFRMGWVEIACLFELPLLLAVTYFLHMGTPAADHVSPMDLTAAVVGAGLVLAAWDLLAWAFLSWRSLFAGHGVLADHRLATHGAYAFVRHPVYLAAFLVWLGLAVAFESRAAFLITFLYVIPVYVLYIRSEEEMMAEAFGEAYRAYRRSVPMLIPRRSSAS